MRARQTAAPGPAGALALVVALALCGVPSSMAAQSPRVESSLSRDRIVGPDGNIELTFNRPLDSGTEGIAVFIGITDVTALFERTLNGLVGQAAMLLQSTRETELMVYRVSGSSGDWQEIGRFPIAFTGRLGFLPARVDPGLSVSYARRLDDGGDGARADPAPRLDVQLSWTSEHESRDVRIKTDASVVGVADRGQALRAGQLGDDAPLFDLSSYAMQAGGGPLSLTVGHVTVGAQRHLIDGFASRGVSVRVAPTEQVSFALGVTGGSRAVGYSNLLGLSEPDHRVLTASLGIEAFDDPGRLRLEVTGLRGSVLAIAGFNQGVVNDAERSQGAALRLTAHGLNRRLRVDAGLARSAFENPRDAALDRGDAALVPVPEDVASARYLEASLEALRSVSLGGSRKASLTLGYRHARVDPQYRSLGAYTTADRLDDRVSAQLDVAGVSVHAGHARSRNNLGEIASILTTDTRRSDAQVRVPTARLTGLTTSWLPTLSVQWNRTHQAGRGIPENGGFDASHVPDQVSTDRTAAADWSWNVVGLGIRWNRSEQDNRQPGRENADLINTRLSATLRWSPGSRLTLAADVGREYARSTERDEQDETLRYGANASLRIFARTSLNLRYSDTTNEDGARTRLRENRAFDAQLSSVVPGLDRFAGEWFVRFARTENDITDATLGRNTRSEQWTVDAGLSFRFF